MHIDIKLDWRDDGSAWFVWVTVKGGECAGFQADTVEEAFKNAIETIKERL